MDHRTPTSGHFTRLPVLWAAVAVVCSFCPSAHAAPSLSGGTVSGTAGSIVEVPVMFDSGGEVVAGVQFDLVIPPSVSVVSVATGAIVQSAGKVIASRLNNDRWTFIVYGMNRTGISSGALLHVKARIASTASGASVTLPVEDAIYASPEGVPLAGSAVSPAVVTLVNATAHEYGDVKVFPNPWKPGTNTGLIRFSGVPNDATMKLHRSG